MKLIHASDLHLITARYAIGDSRVTEALAVLDRLLATAQAEGTKLIVLSGDTFDTRWVSPATLHLFTQWLAECGAAEITVVIIAGNHDGMTTVGDASTHALRWLDALELPHVRVLLEPGPVDLVTHAGPVTFWALPYPHKRAMDAELADVPVDERAIEVGRRVEEAIRTLAVRRPDRADWPFVFVGHVTVTGAKLGSEAAMKLGWDASISADVLAPFDYAALGHIHRQQEVAPNAWYAGSAMSLDFGDAGSPKGFLLVDVKPGEKPTVIPFPSGARPMVDVAFTQDPSGGLTFKLPTALLAQGAIARATIHATVSRPRPEVLSAVTRALRDAGAIFVKTVVDLDLPVVESEQQEVDPEADDGDLLAGWLTDHGQPLEPTMTVGRTLIAAIDAAP